MNKTREEAKLAPFHLCLTWQQGSDEPQALWSLFMLSKFGSSCQSPNKLLCLLMTISREWLVSPKCTAALLVQCRFGLNARSTCKVLQCWNVYIFPIVVILGREESFSRYVHRKKSNVSSHHGHREQLSQVEANGKVPHCLAISVWWRITSTCA